jgi:hypothetical protein
MITCGHGAGLGRAGREDVLAQPDGSCSDRCRPSAHVGNVHSHLLRLDLQPMNAARRTVSVFDVGLPKSCPTLRPLGETLQQESLGEDHLLDLGRVDALVRGVDPRGRHVLGTPQDEFSVRCGPLQSLQQRN